MVCSTQLPREGGVSHLIGRYQSGSGVREWGGGRGRHSEDKAFIVTPPLKGLGEAEQTASGLASLVSFSRLWGTVTVLVVQSPGVQVSGPGFQKGRWRVSQRVRAPQRRWLA